MTFNSLSYLLFLPVVYLVFYCSADRWRWLILLTASYAFYATFKAPYLVAVLLTVTCTSYYCGLRITAQQDASKRQRWLWTGILSCVALLLPLKYLPFLESQANSIFGLGSTHSLNIVGIGVSYFTFQAISYLADVYLEIEEPEPHFGRFALYMAFFPKLLQGPIERAGSLLPQLKEPYQFDYDAMRSGLLLFAWGLFKKVVVADRLALYANQVYNNVHDYTGLALIIGTLAYALQIYFDFAGYTDMARGTGQLFGIRLTENFNSPYLATSIADFWRRWHISFSRWILDYIFKPLQMAWRDFGQAGTALALIVAFLVSGIWHGASWGFVLWGLLHGTYLASSTYYRPYQRRLHKWLGIEKSKWLKRWQVLVTFNLVAFAWIFFRANSLGDAWYVVNNLFNFSAGKTGSNYFKENVLLGQGDHALIVTIIVLLSNIIVHMSSIKNPLTDLRKPVRWLLYYSLTLAIVFLGVFRGDNFVYFKF
jgi:alginate O-acetyltransferase complex protein AlgI